MSWVKSNDITITKATNLAFVMATKFDPLILKNIRVECNTLAMYHNYMIGLEMKGPDSAGFNPYPNDDPIDQGSLDPLVTRFLRSNVYPVEGSATGAILVHTLRDESSGKKVKYLLGLHALVCIHGVALPGNHYLEQSKLCTKIGKSLMEAVNVHNKLCCHEEQGIMCLRILLYTLDAKNCALEKIGKFLLEGMERSFNFTLSPRVEFCFG